MSSSRKRSNSKRVDRISGLPDHLLCHILAFLPTRSAMATSVLSRRWEYVWTGVPVLNFTYDRGDIIDDYLSIAASEQYRPLKYFMNRVLLHNSALYLERVDFAVLPVMTEKDRKEWFKVLSRRSIKEVNLFYDQCYCLPITSLLDGTLREHLVAIRLHCESDYILTVAFTSVICLPRLEKIFLSGVEITDDGEPLRSLIHGSPRLQELDTYQVMGVMNFHCSTLKILKLSQLEVSTASIRVPNLEYFELTRDEEYGYSDDFQYLTGDMPYLAEAKIDCYMRVAMWVDLFQAIRHVIKLNVDLKCFIDETTTVHLKLPCFDRLKCLELYCIEEHSLLQTRMLLRHMPNCVSLIIYMFSPGDDNVDELKGWPEVDSLGLGLHVEYIEIYGFGRNRLVGVELLRDLLVCCTGLKEMKLHLIKWQLNDKQKNVIRKKIMRLSRPSGCKIIIDDPPCEFT